MYKGIGDVYGHLRLWHLLHFLEKFLGYSKQTLEFLFIWSVFGYFNEREFSFFVTSIFDVFFEMFVIKGFLEVSEKNFWFSMLICVNYILKELDICIKVIELKIHPVECKAVFKTFFKSEH